MRLLGDNGHLVPRFRCIHCGGGAAPLEEVVAGWRCPDCKTAYASDGAPLQALTTERRLRFESFQREQLQVRKASGWGGEDPAYYRALPQDGGADWKRRTAGFQRFLQLGLAPFAKAASRPLEILDLGAGMGWLSRRLAADGHRPVALDVVDDAIVGLGAVARYAEGEFVAIQADFDELPFEDQQFDLAVFSASFHYAPDYRRTLREVRRVLGWGGQVAVFDTPVYQHWRLGEQARAERQDDWDRRYGFRGDGLLSMEYLDDHMLDELAQDLNMRWERSGGGSSLYARLTGRAEAPAYPLLIGRWIGT